MGAALVDWLVLSPNTKWLRILSSSPVYEPHIATITELVASSQLLFGWTLVAMGPYLSSEHLTPGASNVDGVMDMPSAFGPWNFARLDPSEYGKIDPRLSAVLYEEWEGRYSAGTLRHPKIKVFRETFEARLV